ncbi:unnamed protein product [Miscanthus lutarioriparius]|uniref:Uncharacterized protein n=1 Tax=Miscanthus lutarioriparius TaxID=422564 RepID=A0A811N3Z3_9POAL|nr:unnamed protein product [Miscanthus lutarioriparius]
MEYRPSFPRKKRSQSGASGSGPRVRNMKATLGTRRNGYRRTPGVNDARQSSSSSVIECSSPSAAAAAAATAASAAGETPSHGRNSVAAATSCPCRGQPQAEQQEHLEHPPREHPELVLPLPRLLHVVLHGVRTCSAAARS